MNLIQMLEAEQVSAHLTTFAERREVYDNVYATLRFPNGVMGRTITPCRSSFW